jgi:ribulose-phosphate 3-epimerase
MKSLIAPSILAADHTNIAQSLSKVKNCDWIHVDIMDNHFVPNLSFSSQMANSVKELSIAPVDTHLMISNPENWIKQFLAGSDSITFHIEATSKIDECIDLIKAADRKAALAIKPNTSWKEVLPYLEKIDMVLVMTVEPGFGGQKFMQDQLEKVLALRSEFDERNLEIRLQVDGGIDSTNIEAACKAGADFFVAGSSIFNAQDPEAALEGLRNLVNLA